MHRKRTTRYTCTLKVDDRSFKDMSLQLRISFVLLHYPWIVHLDWYPPIQVGWLLPDEIVRWAACLPLSRWVGIELLLVAWMRNNWSGNDAKWMATDWIEPGRWMSKCLFSVHPSLANVALLGDEQTFSAVRTSFFRRSGHYREQHWE